MACEQGFLQPVNPSPLTGPTASRWVGPESTGEQPTVSRDVDREAAFLEAAAARHGDAGAGAAGTHAGWPLQRCHASDRWAQLTPDRLLDELCADATDLGAWAALTAQAHDWPDANPGDPVLPSDTQSAHDPTTPDNTRLRADRSAPPYRVRLDFCFARPAWPSHPWMSTLDVEEAARAVLDGLVSGGLFDDDHHVVELVACKRWAAIAAQEGLQVLVAHAREAAG